MRGQHAMEQSSRSDTSGGLAQAVDINPMQEARLVQGPGLHFVGQNSMEQETDSSGTPGGVPNAPYVA